MTGGGKAGSVLSGSGSIIGGASRSSVSSSTHWLTSLFTLYRLKDLVVEVVIDGSFIT